MMYSVLGIIKLGLGAAGCGNPIFFAIKYKANLGIDPKTLQILSVLTAFTIIGLYIKLNI